MELVSMDINQLLIEFKPLIHKTLQRLNIYFSHMDYDDFFQELQLKLVKMQFYMLKKMDIIMF